MRSISRWIVGLCASPLGVVVLGALDSTLFFNLPFGIDASVILLAARVRDWWWAVPLLATAGSVAGAALTFWMGVKVGERGLDRWVDERRLNRIRRRIRSSGAIALAVLDLIPPPFPFTPFVLAAGALEVDARTFLTTLTVCRLFRFGLEAAVAVIYGQRILSGMDSDLFHDCVIAFSALALVLSALALVRALVHPPARRATA
jgi:membrane protein YqaA with SNARE-associated domain